MFLVTQENLTQSKGKQPLRRGRNSRSSYSRVANWKMDHDEIQSRELLNILFTMVVKKKLLGILWTETFNWIYNKISQTTIQNYLQTSQKWVLCL